MKNKFNYRRLLQIVFFALIALISINHNLVERGINIPIISSASLHALCPYGAVESFIAIITAGTMVKKVHEAAIVLLAIVLVLAGLFGPVFCSYVCPLGSFQEWLSKIGKKLFPKKFNKFVPKKLDKWLRFTRYIILIWTVYLSTMSLKLVFEAYDPYYALFNFWSGEIAITSLIVLGLVIISSLFIERAWCKYACPFGALLGLTNLFRIFKIRRSESTCTSCNLCSKNCPMNIDVAKSEVVKDHQCISCGICTSEQACPVASTVSLSTKKSKHITDKIVAITIVVILITGIGIAKLTGAFITESEKKPIKIESGKFAGQSDPADIRGSYSLLDISNSFDISVETLAKAFDVDSENKEDFQIKNFEALYDNVGTSSVRQFVALYTGLPYDGESDGLPLSAIEVLLEDGKISKEQYDLFKNKYIGEEDISESETTTQEDPNSESLEPQVEEHESAIIDGEDDHDEQEHTTVSGSTTVQDALDLGISLADLESILESKDLDNNMLVKDIAKNNGLRFSQIKDQLNAILE